MNSSVSIYELMKVSLREAHELVNREQLILLIARSEIHACIDQINHFQLNGKEVCDVIVNYSTDDPTIKLVLIKQILLNCRVANSDYFIEFVYRTMITMTSQCNKDKMMIMPTVINIFNKLTKHYSGVKVNVEFIKQCGYWFTHIINYKSDETLLDVCLVNRKFSNDELKYILKNNDNFTHSLRVHGDSNFECIPECYRDTMENELNKRKLLGKLYE